MTIAADDLELAITLEDFNAWDDDTHAKRMHWLSNNGWDLKAKVINGTRKNVEGMK